uniref:Reverse transcriptase domain-containing protein n=1 Tax=Cucumis melo TaxID=3656 RepID=A0A9I9D788_CUCME
MVVFGLLRQQQAEKERGVPRLVINYKPFNKVLKWIRYLIPIRQDLLKRITLAKVFSKFDMKSGFWQIQIHPADRYKTAFNVPFGQFQWNVMPLGLKNASSEFQKIMNDIFNQYQEFTIVYIDDVLGMFVGRKFSHPFKPHSYNYRDYTKAWYIIFWLQAYNHSWFVTFCKQAYKMHFPNWFQNWWMYFGLSEEIFPVKVQRSYHLFQQSIYSSPLSKTFRFALYFQIPWIFCWNFQLGPSGNFKALSNSLRIKWWKKFNYSHLEVNKIKDWFKANIHLQDMTRQEDEAFLLTKNAVMSTLAGASTQQEFNSVVNNVVVNLSDDNDDLPEDASPASVNDVDDLDYNPYEGLDINDPFLDKQPY